jgi:hypothetical protein
MNFVSTTVLSSTDGISHDTETRLQPATTSAAVDRAYSKPLYEQLRANADDAQGKYDEQTAAMRGMVTLDDEDVAHLTNVQNGKMDRLMVAKKKEEEELEMFRAARMEKGMTTSEIVEEVKDDSNSKVVAKSLNTVKASEKIVNQLQPPKLLMKRKRRRKDDISKSGTNGILQEPNTKRASKVNTMVSTEETRVDKKKIEDESQNEGGALESLLGGYGSDSSSD